MIDYSYYETSGITITSYFFISIMSLLRIYIAVIVVLSCIYSVFYIHWKKITKTLCAQIDSLLYLFDKTVLVHKNNIFDYSTTKTLLYHNQSEFFKNWKLYTSLLPKLLQDIDYIWQLLPSSPVNPIQLQSIKDTYTTWEKIHTLKEYTHTIITILTLWIANIFLP